jgi:hypothetical protein
MAVLDGYIGIGENNTQVGPWQVAIGETEIDRFYPGQFAYADYTVVADFDGNTKEITKFTIVATTTDVVTDVYSKVAVGSEIVDIVVATSPSFVTVSVTPAAGKDGCKVTFTARYFHNSDYS